MTTEEQATLQRLTPEEQAMLQRYIQFMMGGGNAPLASALGPAGGDDPNTNTYQDRMQILRDPFSATFAGPGGSDYGAFMPTIERTPVDNVGWLRAQQWGAAPIGSARRAIYDFVTLDGMDVGTAVQEVRKLIDQDPEGIGSISMSLPLDDLFNGELQPGTGLRKLEEQAYEMQAGLASSPAGAIPDGMGGYYTETEKPSALADKWRNEYALPLPTERYESDPATVLAGLQREGSGYMPGMDGFNPGLSADSAAMNRAMAALSDKPARETTPYPQFGRYTPSTRPAERDPNVPYEPPKFSGWDGLSDAAGKVGGTLAGLFGGVESMIGKLGGFESGGGDEAPTYPTPLITGEMPKRSRAAGNLEDTLAAYAGNRGQKREYDPITRRSSPVNQERRDLQAQINQGVRDRRKIRLASDPGSRNAIDSAMNSGSNGGPLRLQPGQSFKTAEEASAGLSAYLKTPQSTPMMDAIRQRMLAQQLAGF